MEPSATSPTTTTPPPPPPPPPAFHEDPELCRYLLGRITTPHALRIVRSRTPGAGSGLVTARAVGAGDELFRQAPLASSVHDDLRTVCDFCYANSAARITPEGRFPPRRTRCRNSSSATGVGCASTAPRWVIIVCALGGGGLGLEPAKGET